MFLVQAFRGVDLKCVFDSNTRPCRWCVHQFCTYLISGVLNGSRKQIGFYSWVDG